MFLTRSVFALSVLLAGCGQAVAQGAPLQLQPKKPLAPAPSPAKPLTGKLSPIDQTMAVANANDYLNSSPLMTADFVQVGADGNRTEGRLYVQKPGRMRFEYNKPASLEIIADGTSVAVRDKKLGTQDLYFIGQTPLKFLLKEKIDISRDTKILDISAEANSTSIFIEDKATLGGTSRIKLTFDSTSFALKQWKVVDPQGYETLVTLFNVDTTKRPDPSLFKIVHENFRDPSTNK